MEKINRRERHCGNQFPFLTYPVQISTVGFSKFLLAFKIGTNRSFPISHASFIIIL
jgi:hypothetical protein